MIAAGARISLDGGGQVAVQSLQPGAELLNPFGGQPLLVKSVLTRRIGTLASTTRARVQLSPVLLRLHETKESLSSKFLIVSPQQPLLIKSRKPSGPPSYDLVTARTLVSLGEAERVSVAEDFIYCLIITATSGLIAVEGKILKALGSNDLSGTNRQTKPISIVEQNQSTVNSRKD
jgi:hypothetical protein